MRLRQLRSEPDVDQVHRAAAVRGEHVHGLERAEGDGRGGGHGGPVDGAGVGVDAAGRVDGQHRDPARAPRRATSSAAAGRSGPRPERPTMPSSTRSARAIAAAPSGPGRDDRGPPARRSAARPSAWARCGSSSTAVTPTPRRRSSAPAHRASPPLSPAPTSSATRRPAAVGEHPPRDHGEPERGAAHQRTRRDPRQHHPLGGAHLLDREDLAHAANVSARQRHRDGAVVRCLVHLDVELDVRALHARHGHGHAVGVGAGLEGAPLRRPDRRGQVRAADLVDLLAVGRELGEDALRDGLAVDVAEGGRRDVAACRRGAGAVVARGGSARRARSRS